MSRTSSKARIYTVIDVLAGVAVGAYNFRGLGYARTCMTRLREGRDLQEDDVRLFEGVLDAGPGENRVAEINAR